MQATQTGASYRVTQIAVCAVAAVAAPAMGIFFFTAEPADPGKGLMSILIGLLFLGCLIWLVRAYRRMSTTQRAVYAWAITQQHGAATGRGIASDAGMRASATKAKYGELTRDELLRLQALRPENEYPGTLPPAA